MGGAAGHMAHLHENTWLTFGEIKSFLTQVASAEMSPIEKVDGQNIFFRWTPSGIMCARNSGHMKKGGIDEAAYRAMWEGHPAGDAFIQGFEKIKSALENLSADGQEAFKTSQPNSYRFCNTEIMFPANPNLINYDGNYIVLHNLKEVAVDGGKLIDVEVFNAGDKEFDAIVSSLSDVEKTADAKEWQLFGPKFVELNNIADGGALETVTSALDAIGYSDSDKLFKMVEDALLPELKAGNIPDDKTSLMMKRIKLISEGAESSELPGIAAIKKGLNREQKAVITTYGSVQKARNFIGKATAPVAKAISDFAIEVLRGLESFFVTENDEEIARIQSSLQAAITRLEAYDGDDAEKIGEMLEKQLAKLGDVENIASTIEGVIFEYPPGSKNLVKLTGSFAMANQIIGRAARIPSDETETEALDDADVFESFGYSLKDMDALYEAIESQGSKKIAIVGGAFKPPHLGHLSMVDHYAALADEVKIIISNPKGAKSQRFCGDVCLTAAMSKSLWGALLGNRANVSVEVSSAPSPITVAFDSVMPGHPYVPGTTIYLGASDKEGDANRFAGAVRKADPNLNVPDPIINAAPAAQLSSEYMAKLEASPYVGKLPSYKKGKNPQDYSAGDLRFLLEKATQDPTARELAGYFIGPQNVDAYMAAIGLVSESTKLRYSLKRYLL